MDRGLWSVAASFAGNDSTMQQALVRTTAVHDLQQADLLRAQVRGQKHRARIGQDRVVRAGGEVGLLGLCRWGRGRHASLQWY